MCDLSSFQDEYLRCSSATPPTPARPPLASWMKIRILGFQDKAFRFSRFLLFLFGWRKSCLVEGDVFWSRDALFIKGKSCICVSSRQGFMVEKETCRLEMTCFFGWRYNGFLSQNTLVFTEEKGFEGFSVELKEGFFGWRKGRRFGFKGWLFSQRVFVQTDRQTAAQRWLQAFASTN